MHIQPAKIIDREHYDGTYIVKPRFEAQTLETADKVMDDNVIVKEIKVYTTENKSGGNTVIIGGCKHGRNQ